MHRPVVRNGVLELVERDAWLDLFSAAPDDCIQKFGIVTDQFRELAVLACPGVPIVEFNRAMCVGTLAPTTETELDAASTWLQANAAPGWAFQIAPTAQRGAVHDWVRRRAMRPLGTGWAKFSRYASPLDRTQQSKLHVRPVSASSARVFGEIVQAGFGLPIESAEWFSALVGRPGWHLYLAYDGQNAIASGAAFMRHGIAWYGIDATLSEFRRRGAQTALINCRIEDGCSAGLIAFTAETGQPSPSHKATHASYSNYTRAGFEVAFVRPNYKRA